MRFKGPPEKVAEKLLFWASENHRKTISIEVEEGQNPLVTFALLVAVVVVVIIIFLQIR